METTPSDTSTWIDDIDRFVSCEASASMLGFGQRQRWRRRRLLDQPRRRRNLFRPRVASDLNHGPDSLAIRAAMIMLDISELRMKETRWTRGSNEPS
jgi:hypothetical protein